MINLRFVVGDATLPEGEGLKLIAHVCNDVGAWGRGFAQALGQRYPEVRVEYKKWFRYNTPQLGQVQFVPVRDGSIVIANMVAQHNYGPAFKGPYIRYEALAQCLLAVAGFTHHHQLNVSIHLPRIGAGLAGGSWPVIQEQIETFLCSRDLPVTVYDLPDD